MLRVISGTKINNNNTLHRFIIEKWARIYYKLVSL